MSETTLSQPAYMSRLSDYSDQHILDIIHAAGYVRLSGQHSNGQSVHELIHSCGMVNLKNSKTLLSDKRHCGFIPCHPRGKLSLLYLKTIATRLGLDDVTHDQEGQTELRRLTISANDLLRWTKGDAVMTQSWHTVRSRALSCKKGTFFQSDATRRKPRSAELSLSTLALCCAPKRLALPASMPARRADKVEYTHIACGGTVALRFVELQQWSETRCPHCHSLEKTALDAFKAFLLDFEMTFDATLEVMERKSQVKRSQAISITCNLCHQRNDARSYDLVRYRGFTYCDNPGCSNTYLPADRTCEPDQYYIDLLRTHGIRKFADGQRLFPRSMRYLKQPSAASPKGAKKPVRKYEIVQQALDLPVNTRLAEFTDDDLRSAFQHAIDAGATNIGAVRAKLPNDINNFISRRRMAGDFVHHRVLANMGIRFKRSYEIASLHDAIESIRDTKSATWAEFVSRYPGASTSIIEQGLKEDVMASFGWTSLVNYSRLTNQQLLDKAGELRHAEQLDTLALLERAYGSLIRNIRERGLTADLCAAQGFEQTAVWQGMSLDDLVRHIRDNDFASSSDWHASSSGSYKYAATQNWVREISKRFNWGIYRGLNGFSYDSLPETIVANLLHLADYEFIDHPPIEDFPGVGGGRPTADFLIDSPPLWIEVWAYRTDDVVSGKLASYPSTRKHKEAGYLAHAMPLCNLEGGLFYRPYLLDGKQYRRGMGSFVEHACNRLTAHGLPIVYTPELLAELRQSVHDQSDSAFIQL
ncbi:hypothetical protein LOY57_15190 [Pseudomonas moraviensis]|uniref:hypothetical protein n=1 Tax=Pseudomonas moraviensis TaxID=321662 RepID=UPI002160582F|nr:hypothetical protein [Pseudomonas moraviensis]UVL44063.1 hypothetical protein LOY57_15190 [Pseudomonas moraviensis]